MVYVINVPKKTVVGQLITIAHFARHAGMLFAFPSENVPLPRRKEEELKSVVNLTQGILECYNVDAI